MLQIFVYIFAVRPMLNYIMKLIVSIILCLIGAGADDTMGPADITIERLEECEQPELYEIKFPVTMKKTNRTHAGFSGCVDLLYDLDSTTFINLTAAKWGDGGWKPNALNFDDADVCVVLEKYVKKPWNDIRDEIGLSGKPCPMPKGNYCSDKLVLELKGLFPSMLYGKFRLDVKISWNMQPKLCIRAYVNSEPSRPRKPYK